MERDVVFKDYLADAKQDAIRKVYKDIFFQYIMKVHELCRNRISKSCYKEVLKDFEDLSKAEDDAPTDTYMAKYV